MSEHAPEQINNLAELVKQSRDPRAATYALTIDLTLQARDNHGGNVFYTAACREEPGIGGYGENHKEAVGDLLETLGMRMANNQVAMELDKVLEREE